MGADWYFASCIFGYIIEIPKNSTHRRVLKELHTRLQKHNSSTFTAHGLVSEIHSRLEYSPSYEFYDFEQHYGFIVFGFNPVSLSNVIDKQKELTTFVAENKELFDGFTLKEMGFYGGISWDYSEHVESEDEDEDEEEDE